MEYDVAMWSMIGALGVKPVFNPDDGQWEFKYEDINGVTVIGKGKTISHAAEVFYYAIK